MAHTCHCMLALGPAPPESKGKDFRTPFLLPPSLVLGSPGQREQEPGTQHGRALGPGEWGRIPLIRQLQPPLPAGERAQGKGPSPAPPRHPAPRQHRPGQPRPAQKAPPLLVSPGPAWPEAEARPVGRSSHSPTHGPPPKSPPGPRGARRPHPTARPGKAHGDEWDGGGEDRPEMLWTRAGGGSEV